MLVDVKLEFFGHERWGLECCEIRGLAEQQSIDRLECDGGTKARDLVADFSIQIIAFFLYQGKQTTLL